jgi:S-adenosylmethionine:tRNA ribosyltransferase-isomerase
LLPLIFYLFNAMPGAPKNIRIEDYNYPLPDERIARFPLPERDASKLLVYKDQQISTDIYRNIDQHLPAGAFLVFNNTKVIPARLQFVKPSGGGIEIFCLEPDGEPSSSMLLKGHATWNCLIGGAKKWKSGPITLENSHLRLQAEWIEKGAETHKIKFSWTPSDLTFAEMLTLTGQIPLPPYLQRPAEASDAERYQTVYAQQDGSVAAPTAGLHFTPQIFDTFKQKQIQCDYVALHVGAGTFKPVKTDTIGEHEMHAEFFDIDIDMLRRWQQSCGKAPVVATGTTSLRTLESIFLMGSKLLQDPDLSLEALEIDQWDAYAAEHQHQDVLAALSAMILYLEKNGQHRLIAKTRLMIAPGYQIRTIDALITNFHQPSSTLLLLVAALVGDDWKKIYQYALDHQYRFLSYGDGSLLFKKPY